MAEKGPELLLNSAAIGWPSPDSDEEAQRQLDAWLTPQRPQLPTHLPLLLSGYTGYNPAPGPVSMPEATTIDSPR
ncbi:MAG: hypothetical protein ACWA5X_12175 [bacterium]